MKVAAQRQHPLLEILFVIFVLTIIAFAIEGCPTLAKERYHENQKAAVEIYNPGLVFHL